MLLYFAILLCFLTSEVSMAEVNVEVVSVHGGVGVRNCCRPTCCAMRRQNPVGCIFLCLAACIIQCYGADPILCYCIFGNEHGNFLFLFITRLDNNILNSICSVVYLICNERLFNNSSCLDFLLGC